MLKFGGTSVADIDRIRNAAQHVKREVDAGHACAVVVSAMAGQTNQLVSWVEEAWGVAERRGQGHDVSVQYDCKEYDAVVASGEQVTSGLLAIVLQSMGVKARSWQGWQIPLMTDNAHRAARIKGVAIDELKALLAVDRNAEIVMRLAQAVNRCDSTVRPDRGHLLLRVALDCAHLATPPAHDAVG